jgi:hypothetical protein
MLSGMKRSGAYARCLHLHPQAFSRMTPIKSWAVERAEVPIEGTRAPATVCIAWKRRGPDNADVCS